MSQLSHEQEILLKEYQEAFEVCRDHGQLVRSGLSIFATAQAAIIGLIGTQKITGNFELVMLEVLGLWLSVIVCLTTLRLRYRYGNYMERIKCLERQLGMNLYLYSHDYFELDKIFCSKIPGRCGNKFLWASFPLITFILYAFLLIRDGKRFFSSFLF